MKRYKPGSKEYNALAALNHDLQPGTIGWNVSFGKLNRGTFGATSVRVANLQSETKIRITGVGGTKIDPAQNRTMSLYLSTIVTEAGTYEAASGRAGGAIQAKFADAIFSDFGETWDGEFPTDHEEDAVTNAYFNVPVGVQPDQ